MEYNFSEHVKLLTYENELKKKNQSMRIENPLEFSELRKYSLMINDYLHWCIKNQYLQLIQDFLNSKIDAVEFDKQFCEKVQGVEKNAKFLLNNYELLEEIHPTSSSFEFAEIISEIYLCCNEFYPSMTEADRSAIPFGKTEEQLLNSVQELLLEVKKYF